MPEPEGLISLGLNAPPERAPVVAGEPLPAAETLQFRRAEHALEQQPGTTPSYTCAACKRPIVDRYFRSGEVTLCATCPPVIERALNTPPATPVLVKSILYGFGAALAGSILYAVVIATVGQFALIAILIGYMVGKAMRAGAKGRGSRPQQIAAVILTYLGITMSFSLFAYYKMLTVHIAATVTQRLVATILVLPTITFMGLTMPFRLIAKNPAGIFTLVIIFLALVRAWQMTGRPKFALTGPFEINGSNNS